MGAVYFGACRMTVEWKSATGSCITIQYYQLEKMSNCRDRLIHVGFLLMSLKNQFYLCKSFNPSLAITTFHFFLLCRKFIPLYTVCLIEGSQNWKEGRHIENKGQFFPRLNHLASYSAEDFLGFWKAVFYNL